MRCAIRLMAIACFGLAALQADPAQAEKRLALSVGIDLYDNLPALEQLKTAVNDARAMGQTLRELGFETTVEENLQKVPFTRAWQKFLNRLEPGDTAALFFAGHGVEIAGLNYLLPRDVPKVVPGEDQVLAEGSIRFNGLMDNLRDKRVRVALFIVDACRDNPFRDGIGRSVGGTRGLARIEPAEGSFVMYSAGAGEQALDRLLGADGSPNSVYTRTLLPILKTPGLSLREIAGRVQDEVIELARAVGRKQTPAYYDQAAGKLVLKVGAALDTKPSVVSPALATEAAEVWDRIREIGDPAILEAFIKRFETTFYAEMARSRLRQLKLPKVAVAPPPPSLAAAPVTDCDRLAASSYDTEAAAPGIETTDIDHVRAIPACEFALAQHPKSRRLSFQLGRAYFAAKRDDDALRLFREAAALGSVPALTNLGVMYSFGRGMVIEDHAEALRLYRKAAELGNVPAMFNLGMNYVEGLGAASDDAEAVRWFQLAAEKGYWPAMGALGEMYEAGRGVSKNEVEAARWYLPAAEKGDPLAMTNLGVMYYEGRAVAKDQAKAVRWFRQATGKDHVYAIYNLGKAHDAGVGGARKDPREAANLVYTAIKDGDPQSVDAFRLQISAFSEGFWRALQRRLKDAGRYDGPIDGKPDAVMQRIGKRGKWKTR